MPAKINLQLSVGPREEDGYHDLISVFQAISIYDDITVTKSPPGEGITISVVGDQVSGVPTDAANLAVQAAQLIATEYVFEIDAHILVKKAIPVAGGMAGGSADAAATMTTPVPSDRYREKVRR